MELKCPSLDYVYSMTWAEFQIRAYAYNREQDLISYRFRKVGFSAMWAFHSDPKKLPRREDKYWEIGEQTTTLNDNQIEAIKAAVERYKQEINGK
jgi:hypothetical protein